MDDDEKKIMYICCAACCACMFVFILLVGWDAVEVTAWGLKCNKLSKTCSDDIYSPGRYLVGPFNHFIEFPGSVQMIEFSSNK